MFNVSLSRYGFEEWGNKGLLEVNEKVPVDRERFIMVIIIGKIIAETYFTRKVE